MPSFTGKTLGKVRVEMYLAKGGMADVYIGTHTTLHRPVAIKFLKADLQGEPELRERFEREARVIAMLRHPNIIQVFDFDSYENQPFLVMEYVPGVSLGSYLRELHKKSERLDLVQVQSLFKKIAGALTYAHENNVVHRDVKPANILLTSRSMPVTAGKPLPKDTEPILTDFGLVRFTQSNAQTITGTITGTPYYMSPEQANGKQVDARTDVYSLGVTLYEMLAGQIPFDGDTPLGVLHRQVHDAPPPIEGLSKRVQEVIERALAKDSHQRFQTPLEFVEAFEAALTATTEAETAVFPSAITKSFTLPREKVLDQGSKTRKALIPRILIGVAGVMIIFGAFIAAQGGASRTPKEVSPSLPAVQPTTETADAPSNTSASVPINTLPPEVASVGLLRFQDGSAQADQVTFSSSNLPIPPQGSQYEAWLIEDDGESRFSIGVIQFNDDNRATLTFVDDRGRNLIGSYHGLELTLEPEGDTNPNPSNEIAFFAMVPPGGYTHVRHLLASFPSNPNGVGFVHGLRSDTTLLNDIAKEMLVSFEANDDTTVRLQAEQMLNLIVGNQSQDYKDWNGNVEVDDPADGFGLLLNGSNIGYIQGTFSHANLSLTSPDASENMLIHGEHVKIAATNVSEWTAQLRDQLIQIMEAPSLAEAEGAIRQAVVLSNQILNGVDINGNENIEAISGEGGAMTAYDHAYYMADIVLTPFLVP